MKTLIGILAALITLAFVGLLILRVWDIKILSFETIARSSITLAILGVTSLVLIVVYGAFLKNTNRNYNNKVGNRAHPKA
ncbi:hypothetical protein [Mucilaginibacter aquatilis]|uniref:Uncharacterized protein n=1 Tax=Mucilaginibacter aquatilis TaxID=1517760 RepID=A0A6I4IEI6_9SPHI|nr:hypothetical protein [Mucilaginibacter aquatilis]MVN91779.1 hypothetical protein [Mucilaginibacter aquatilis]